MIVRQAVTGWFEKHSGTWRHIKSTLAQNFATFIINYDAETNVHN
jgi:hypothetical protein